MGSQRFVGQDRRSAQYMTDGITLKEYVKETLLSITEAVIEAQQVSASGSLIGRAPLESLNKFTRDLQGNTVTHVDFDVATTVEASQTGGASGSVKVVALGGLSAGGQKAEKYSGVSRVAFSVPLAIAKPSDQQNADNAYEARQNAIIKRHNDQNRSY